MAEWIQCIIIYFLQYFSSKPNFVALGCFCHAMIFGPSFGILIFRKEVVTPLGLGQTEFLYADFHL